MTSRRRPRGRRGVSDVLRSLTIKRSRRLQALLKNPADQLDHRLREAIAQHSADQYVVNVKQLPAYRFVDAYRAIEACHDANTPIDTIDTRTDESLAKLLHADAPDWCDRKIARSSQSAWSISDEEEVYLPTGKFWIFSDGSGESPHPVIVHLEYERYSEQTRIELAACDPKAAKTLLTSILDHSVTHSIYRKQLISIRIESGSKDEHVDVEKPQRLRIRFKLAKPVSREQFVIDDDVFNTLWRNVIDLHRRAALLKQHGVPLRRGVLLHGPPGTGKTYACRYVCGELTQTTRIVAAGSALHTIGQVFDLARLYQPSLVVLEDVDLVFASREINLYSSSLGELLDQMDGLRPDEDVGVVLTTNSIERMESAIKDRPGRISQCIYLGPPCARLRQRYLEHYIGSHDKQAIDLPQLVAQSDETTPAFIKEWVHRAVQIATERIGPQQPVLQLTTRDFDLAHEEMVKYTDVSSQRIIGFVGR